jgi:hypothetical protein
MGQPSIQPVNGSFEATGTTAEFAGNAFNVSISGLTAGDGAIELQRSFDGGTVWKVVKAYTADAEERCDDPESGVHYRLEVTTYVSGTFLVRLSR